MALCDDCPTGSYCDHYELNNITGVVVPTPCPAGYYCPINTEFATQYPCPTGTFSNDTSLEAEGRPLPLYRVCHVLVLFRVFTPLFSL